MKKNFHVFRNDVLSDYDAFDLSRLIKKKDISPREAILAAIERAKLAAPYLDAVEIDCYDEALQNGIIERSGVFANVP